MCAWCLGWDGTEVTALFTGPAQWHMAGMTKTQMIRTIGFLLIVCGGALFVTACRRQRRLRRATLAARQHERYQLERYQYAQGWYAERRTEQSRCGRRRRYNWPTVG